MTKVQSEFLCMIGLFLVLMLLLVWRYQHTEVQELVYCRSGNAGTGLVMQELVCRFATGRTGQLQEKLVLY